MNRQLIFNGLASTGWFITIVLVIALTLGVMFWLFKYERRLISRRLGITLFGLRCLSLLVVLAMLLEPVLTWVVNREKTGRVAVAVDLSESMTTIDSHAENSEKLRWARGLGMIGNKQTELRMQQWQEAFDSGQEPKWVEPSETQDPQKLTQLEQIRKDGLTKVLNEVGEMSRRDIAVKLITTGEKPLIDRINELAILDLYGFAGEIQSTTADELKSPTPEKLVGLSTGLSNLMLPLTQVGSSGADDSKMAGIVLLTDGRDTLDGNPVEAAKRLGELGVPVYPVLLGSQIPPKDLSVASLDYPLSAYIDDKPVVKALLNTSGFEGSNLTVKLKDETGQELDSRSITPDSSSTRVEFQLDASDVGRHRYTISTDVQPGETRDDNNSREFAINIIDDTVRALILENEARWEFRYLQTALERDDRVDVKQVVFRQPYLGMLPKTFFERSLQAPIDPDDPAQSPFAETDIVIVGDVSSAQLTEQHWQALEKFVTEAGGTVVLTAGRNNFPLGSTSPIVERMMPITEITAVDLRGLDATKPPSQRGFKFNLTPEGEELTMMQFDIDREANLKIWKSLPGHTWGLTGKAKQGTTVFATMDTPDAAEALGLDRDQALVVQQHYGFGQVLWIGVDSTWRWRHRVGDKFHHRFWGQVCRWAADNKAAAGNQSVKFGPERTDILAGEDAIIRARWSQQFLRRFPKLEAKVEVYRVNSRTANNRPFSTVELEPIETRPLLHEGRVGGLPVGEYRVRLLVDNADFQGEVFEADLYVNEPQTAEFSDLSANSTLLQEIAAASGGRVFQANELEKLPELFSDVTTSSSTQHDYELWNHWSMLLVFFGLMMVEWCLRKINGLP